jgi:hypothetical protein
MYKSLVKVELASESKVTFRSATFKTAGYEESSVIVSVVFSTGETELGLSEIDCFTAATWVTERDESTTPLTVIVKDTGAELICVKP